MKQFALALVALLLVPAAAHADRSSYCQAYARDFADGIARDKATWDHKYQIALSACMEPDVKADVPPVPKLKPEVQQTAAKPAEAAPAPDAVPPAQEGAKPEAATAAKDGKPAPGSQAWNDYCAKKYASFDPKTGMYKSMKGVARPCLVTKDFKG